MKNPYETKIECQFVQRRKLDGTEINWCTRFQAVCEDIRECEFKNQG